MNGNNKANNNELLEYFAMLKTGIPTTSGKANPITGPRVEETAEEVLQKIEFLEEHEQ